MQDSVAFSFAHDQPRKPVPIPDHVEDMLFGVMRERAATLNMLHGKGQCRRRGLALSFGAKPAARDDNKTI
jgi:hypothetical protein